MIDALAVLGVLATLSAGASPLVVVVVLAIAIALPERWRAHPIVRRGALAAAMGALAIEAFRVSSGAAVVPCVVECLISMQIARIATRRGAEADRQIAVLSFLGAALAGVFGGGPVYGALLVALLLIAPGALALSHLRREVEGNYRQGARDRTGMPVDVPRILRSRRVVGRDVGVALGVVGIATVLAGVAAFVLMPRVGLGWFGLDARTRFLPDRIDLSRRDVPDDGVVLRFTVDGLADPPAIRPLRFRGAVLDAYDGKTWTHRATEAVPYVSGTPRGTKITVDREPLDPPLLFVPTGTTAIAAPLPLTRTADGELRFVAPRTRALRYDVFIAPDAHDDSPPLAGTAAITPRARALAHAWADAEPDARSKARAIEKHLREGYAYDLRSPSRGAEEPLEHFLFTSRRGHCELFATAAATMLRESGVPTRVVTGYLGGTWNRFGRFYVVRESDAHAWTEAFVDGAWITVDATPSAPRAVPNGALDVARELGEAVTRDATDPIELGGWRLFAIIVLLALFVIWLLFRWRHHARDAASPARERLASPRAACDATELYTKLEAALARSGLARDAALPPLRYAEMLAAQRHPLAPEVIALTNVYLEARFGGAVITTAARRDFERRVKMLVKESSPPRT
jgi:transglutaminase-like putative cysteine protease